MPKSSTSIARVTGLQVINILCVVGGVPGSQRETFPFVKTTRNQQTGPPIQLPSSLTSHNSIIWAVLLAVMRVPVVLFSPRTVFVPCLLAGWLAPSVDGGRLSFSQFRNIPELLVKVITNSPPIGPAAAAVGYRVATAGKLSRGSWKAVPFLYSCAPFHNPHTIIIIIIII